MDCHSAMWMCDIRYVAIRMVILRIGCDRGCGSRCNWAKILDVLLRDDETNNVEEDKIYDGSKKGLQGKKSEKCVRKKLDLIIIVISGDLDKGVINSRVGSQSIDLAFPLYL